MPGRSRGGAGGGRGRGSNNNSRHSDSPHAGSAGRGSGRGGRSSGPRGGRAASLTAGSPHASRSQSINTPPTRLETYSASHHNRNGAGRGSTPGQYKRTPGGRASQPPVPQHASGLVNPYLYVELERSHVWKVSVPHGQAFGKQFLAGLEVWAEAMLAAYQGDKGIKSHGQGATAGLMTTPPPPPPKARVAVNATVGQASTVQPQASNSSASTATAAAAAASSQGPLDWVTYLSGEAATAAPVTPSPSSSKRTISAPPHPHATPTDNFYRPQVQREEPSPASNGSQQGLVAEQQQMLEGGYLGGLEPTSDGEAATAGSASPAHSASRQWWPTAEGDDTLQSSSSQAMQGMEAVVEDVEHEEGEEGHGEGEGEEAEEHCDSEDGQEDEGEDEDQDDDVSYDYDDMAFADPADVHGDLDALSEDMFAHEDQLPSSPPPAAVSAAPPASTPTAGSIPTLGVVRGVGRSAGGSVRVRVSLRLERHALTDTELELFTRWYQERGVQLVELSKLWLFDNRLGDGGAACVAALMHPGLLEVHLSHNSITTPGAELLLSSIPTERGPAQGRPLWLRLEWNIINPAVLLAFAEDQRRLRGLRLDVPKVVASGERGHEMNLQLKGSPHLPRAPGAAADAHACMPWLQCQKQPPSESAILQDVKNIYRLAQPSPAVAQATVPTPPPPARTPSQSAAPLLTPPPPITKRTTSGAGLAVTEAAPKAGKAAPIRVVAEAVPVEANEAVLQQVASVGAQWAEGPLLLFPDTSALISMLGANIDLPKPVMSLDALTQLARAGRFGRSLGRSQQTFLVVADSVMKQLDGLKSLPNARAAIRAFLSEGLEECGPAGLDFLTVLGAHEGEGLALSAGALGAAGSRSPFLANKGQAVDYRIVEVALFFMNEVVKAAGGGSQPGSGAATPTLPVMLLSNDNAQVLAAKAHGLPAVRLAGEKPEVAATLQAVTAAPNQGDGGLTSTLIRGLLGPAATSGLGSTAPAVTLQESFDAAVAALHATTAAVNTAQAALQKISSTIQLATTGQIPADSAVAAIQAALQAADQSLVPAARFTSSTGSVTSQISSEGGTTPAAAIEVAAIAGASGESGGGLAASLQGLLTAVQGPLAEWDARCRSHQQPSRVLKWALPSNWS